MKKNIYEVIYFDVQEGCVGSIMLKASDEEEARDKVERSGEFEVIEVSLHAS